MPNLAILLLAPLFLLDPPAKENDIQSIRRSHDPDAIEAMAVFLKFPKRLSVSVQCLESLIVRVLRSHLSEGVELAKKFLTRRWVNALKEIIRRASTIATHVLSNTRQAPGNEKADRQESLPRLGQKRPIKTSAEGRCCFYINRDVIKSMEVARFLSTKVIC